jgi:CheY-like chemotaxis protein
VATTDHVRGSVLTVDDEPTIAEVLARYLERAGYEVRAVGDGPSAVEAVAARAPDLVVLDLMLPTVDPRAGAAPGPA